MTMLSKSALVLAATSMMLSGFAMANEPLKPEEMIKFRKAGYSSMAWNMGKIKNNLDGKFNKDEVQNAANVIAAVANSGMGALYAPGTDKDHGDQKTRLKSKFFAEPEKVREIAMNFNREANALAKVSAGGNVAAINTQYKRVNDSCKACHDRYRTK
ncbi:MAG TPA: cytochrome c [Thiobacillaceae bacterium]|nr:cytochrome c [Thiobacillaceae bacterium]